MSQGPAGTGSNLRADVISAWALGALAVGLLGLMLLHPTTHAHSMEELQSQMSEIGPVNAAVHGLAIGAEWMLVASLLALCDVLGMGRLVVRAALAMFIGGAAAATGAALTN